jgi:hypothetical protein
MYVYVVSWHHLLYEGRISLTLRLKKDLKVGLWVLCRV